MKPSKREGRVREGSSEWVQNSWPINEEKKEGFRKNIRR